MQASPKRTPRGRLDEQHARSGKAKQFIVDGLGKLLYEQTPAHLIARLYDRGSLLITSNRSVGRWTPDPAMLWPHNHLGPHAAPAAMQSPPAATPTGSPQLNRFIVVRLRIRVGIATRTPRGS